MPLSIMYKSQIKKLVNVFATLCPQAYFATTDMMPKMNKNEHHQNTNHLHLRLKLYATYYYPSSSCTPDILFTDIPVYV